MSGIMNMFVAAKTTVAAAVDEFFNRVTLLLNTGSTNGAQNNTFLDSSSNGFSITRNGNTTQGTFTPFSQTGWGNYFGGSADYLSIADTATLELGSGNFTIEGWIYLNSLPAASGYYAIVGKWVNTQYSYICNMVNNAGTMQLSFSYTTNGTTSTTVAANAGITANTWHHVAYVRNGSGFKIFLNGTEVTSSATISGTLFDGTAALNIGRNGDASQYFSGYISNLRICKAAVYTANFTPSTTSLTTTSQSASSCVLLTCQDNRFLDNASSLTISIGGTPRVQAFSPFSPTAAYSTTTVGGSGYFDGSVDYLSSTSNTSTTFGTSAYTVQMWVYQTSRNASGAYLLGGVGTQMIQLNITSTGTVNANLAGGSNYATTTATVPLNAWTHLAFVRTSTAANGFQIYINGVSSATGTDATNYISTNTLNIGTTNNSGTFVFTGYISGLQILNGTAASISVPTAPPTNITNTSLLLNYTNAGIYDAASKNVLETVGNAQVSTTQAKFGTTSMYFDGTGDYITLPASQNFNLSTGDFTIECWFYYSTTPPVSTGYDYLWGLGGTGTTGLGLYIQGGVPKIWNGSLILTTTGSISATTWYHIAVVRSSGTLTVYLNGTSIGSVSMTSNLSGGSSVGFNIARWINFPDPEEFTGYIDELRITRYARYTSNFSVPTAAFPVQ